MRHKGVIIELPNTDNKQSKGHNILDVRSVHPVASCRQLNHWLAGSVKKETRIGDSNDIGIQILFRETSKLVTIAFVLYGFFI